MLFSKGEGVVKSARTFKFRLSDPDRPQDLGDVFRCDGQTWLAIGGHQVPEEGGYFFVSAKPLPLTRHVVVM